MKTRDGQPAAVAVLGGEAAGWLDPGGPDLPGPYPEPFFALELEAD